MSDNRGELSYSKEKVSYGAMCHWFYIQRMGCNHCERLKAESNIL